MTGHEIKIGTMVGGYTAPKLIRQINQYGFESYALNFWQTTDGGDLAEFSKEVKEAIGDSGAIISCVGVFGNPLQDDNTLDSLKKAIKTAKLFGTDLVNGFSGALAGQTVEESMPRFTEVFTELCKLAESEGVRIAFENCPMGGDWDRVTTNLAFCPRSWELMFNALPFDNIGLQWEPCHQMVQLIDPIPQLRKWAKKIFNLHGKDATINWDIIREQGIGSGSECSWHRTPGFGDSNWSDIITILRQNDFVGSIDIEGWHDPIYSGDLEYTGQVHGLNYLKNCRGGAFIPNPEK